MIQRPETQYTNCGDVTIAYQAYGGGPIDLVLALGWISNIEYLWENSDYTRFIESLGKFSRVLLFDRRGTGLSDRNVGVPTLEQRSDDIRAVMDACNSERAAIFGVSEGGNMASIFAATYPERTVALILYASKAKGTWAEDYPWPPTEGEMEEWLQSLKTQWGNPFDLSVAAPSVADDETAVRWFSALLRYSASPKEAVDASRINMDIDIREILPTIQVPTAVIQRTGDQWQLDIEETKYLASRIPNAKLILLPGNDRIPWWGDQNHLVAEIEEFLTGNRTVTSAGRVLLTVLITDIVGSTEQASELGDEKWSNLLEKHNRIVRRNIALFDGKEVNTTGDGFVISFTGPTRSIQCMQAIHRDIEPLGLGVRAGIHTGECERRNDDLSGVAVHLAARISDLGKSGQTIVSSTVKDLVVGSGLIFDEIGAQRIKGFQDEWRLFGVSS
jgi:pimeloyl-ACP methyl ester carboxylesterase